MRERIIPTKQPETEKIIAFWAFPSKRREWPGRIEREVSSLGAPRKIEGMKSMKVWVIERETMNIIRKIGES